MRPPLLATFVNNVQPAHVFMLVLVGLGFVAWRVQALESDLKFVKAVAELRLRDSRDTLRAEPAAQKKFTEEELKDAGLSGEEIREGLNA